MNCAGARTVDSTPPLAGDGPLTAIVGMGETGLSCLRYLSGQGARCVIMDTRAAPPAAQELRSRWPEVPCFTGGLDAAALAAAQEIIVSPGLALDLPELRQAAAAGARVGAAFDATVDIGRVAVAAGASASVASRGARAWSLVLIAGSPAGIGRA